jgi:GTP-binding protein
LKISAEFIASAAGPRDFPRDGLPEIAMVGRSNVGKSTLINALTRQRLARTSAAPGKTRLANIYRVARGAAAPFYLVDLPGYGYARRSKGDDGVDFEALTQAFFSRDQASALLLVDTRHPGLESDRAAWQWLHRVAPSAIVGTKFDKLARGPRMLALRQLESVFEDTVLPVSAVTGEGLDELWKLIDRLTNSRRPQPTPSSPSRPPEPMEPPPSTPRQRSGRTPTVVEGPRRPRR